MNGNALDNYITGNYGEDQFDWLDAEDEEMPDIAPRWSGSFDDIEIDGPNRPLSFWERER